MSLFAEAMSMSRQNLYKTFINADLDVPDQLVIVKDKIDEILSDRPGLPGTAIRRELNKKGINIGRDRLYAIINGSRLTMNSRRKLHRSRYRLKAAPNLISNKSFYRVFEVLFADYTQIKTEEGNIELLMVEDLISRYITAYRISDTSKSGPVVEALNESIDLKQRLGLRYNTILHTDRGTEFVNHAVRGCAFKHGIILSNTGDDHCFDNPFMESLNKTLKHTMGLRVTYRTIQEALNAIEVAINSYNSERKHSSLGMRIPHCVLTSYTARKSSNPGRKTVSGRPSGRAARHYCKSLKVKIKKNRLDRINSRHK